MNRYLVPINKTAALVVSKGVHFEVENSNHDEFKKSPYPTWKKRPSSLFHNSDFEDLTGRKQGKLTVIGLLKGVYNKWVCRCICGNYTLRRAKAIRNINNKFDCCGECRKLAQVKRNYVYKTTGKDQDINNFY
ncbi:hypothetical protein SAMN05660772_02066 [Pasteurella testudinis DSM 23072]|uniref:Uncharacterized protein n=1 Tax=Pasteurella testudinis DSM 23072 TaxID=1122938 RepID=A0A1W1UMM5_9PAST|nr:hypothetical protein [Pasteurella testudinis]SMB82342.1 hypothetical protein SAMN05660772_02066 [Pasteurella testudinis DSM 23072]SUB52248.1 Uncharacterised protein [Pasteurella testudinis]